MIRIPLDQIQSDALSRFHFDGQKQELGLGKIEFPVEELEVLVSVAEADQGYVLTAEVTGEAQLTCHRCLEAFSKPLDLAINALAVFDSASTVENEDAEVIEISAQSNYIDATQLVYDGILLNLPYKLLCREDCKGLCDQCGQNLNHGTCDCEQETIDPRWEKLKEINFEE